MSRKRGGAGGTPPGPSLNGSDDAPTAQESLLCLNRDVGTALSYPESSRGGEKEAEPQGLTARDGLFGLSPETFPCGFQGRCGSVGASLTGSRALGLWVWVWVWVYDPFRLWDWDRPLQSNEKMSPLHRFYKRLLSSYNITHRQNAAAMPAKTQRPRARVSLSPASAEGRVPGTCVRNSRASPAAAAPGLRAPEGGTAHTHAPHGSAGLPRPRPRRRRRAGRGREARGRSRRQERQAGQVPAGGARAFAPPLSPAPVRPPPSPARGLRAPARARAHFRKPGPSGAAP